MLEATRITTQIELRHAWYASPASWFLVVATGASVLLNLLAIALVRVWNPSREIQLVPEEESMRERLWPIQPAAQPAEPRTSEPTPTQKKPAAPSREVWDNPVLWREIRTAAYGRKILVIRAAYVAFFAGATALLWYLVQVDAGLTKLAAATARTCLSSVCCWSTRWPSHR